MCVCVCVCVREREKDAVNKGEEGFSSVKRDKIKKRFLKKNNVRRNDR